MEKTYQIIRVISRKNKQNSTYYLALVLFNREDDSDLIRILVTPEQADTLIDFVGDSDLDDITKYVEIDYNKYQKVYQPKITI